MIKLFSRKNKKSRYQSDQNTDQTGSINNIVMGSSVADMFSISGAAGVAINEKTAMQVSAVYACVSLIGGAIASMPMPIYRRSQDGRERVDHDVWWLLNEEPNPACTSAVFWESLVGSLLLHGDAFARIIRASQYSSKIIGFEWLHSHRVEVSKVDGGLTYTVQPDANKLQFEKAKVYAAADMIHIPGPGFNGLHGMSQIKYVLRTSAGIALAADQYSADFFKNGARPDFAIEMEGKPTVEQQDMIRKSWSDRFQGPGRSHLPALLVGGSKVHELTMNAEDTQLLGTREFQVEDICRIFGTPPHMVGHTKNTSSWGTGVEQMSIGFVKYTLSRHLTKIEQEFNRKIWPIDRSYFAEFNTAGLERGDYKTRHEGYRIALGRAGEPGWMTVNEVRKIENQSPIAGGDELNKGSTNESTTTKTA